MKISQVTTHCHHLQSSLIAGKEEQEQCRALESKAELQRAASLQGLDWRCSSSEHQGPSAVPSRDLSYESVVNPGNLVAVPVRHWKYKVQLQLSSLAETQSMTSPSLGSQKWRLSDSGFKHIWIKWADQNHLAFIVQPESPGTSGSLLNKNPGLTP